MKCSLYLWIYFLNVFRWKFVKHTQQFIFLLLHFLLVYQVGDMDLQKMAATDQYGGSLEKTDMSGTFIVDIDGMSPSKIKDNHPANSRISVRTFLLLFRVSVSNYSFFFFYKAYNSLWLVMVILKNNVLSAYPVFLNWNFSVLFR